MTEAEELELLELENEAAQAPAQPRAEKPLQVGGGETFLNKTASALPVGKQIVTGGAALLRRALGFGDANVRLTPQAQAEAERLQGRDAGPLGNVDVPAGPQTLGQQYRGAQDAFETRTAAGAEQHPVLAGLGTGVGTALSLAAPLPKVSVGSGVSGRILSNALTAAGYGAVNSGANSHGSLMKGEVGQVLSDAVGVGGLRQAAADAGEGRYGRAALDTMGAGGVGGLLTGGMLGAGVEGVRASGAIPAVGGFFKRVANKQSFKALGGMKPEINELGEKAAQQIGANALESGVVTPLAGRKTMLERALGKRNSAGEEINSALAGEAPVQSLTKEAAAQKVEALADSLAGKPALKGIADKFRTQAEAIRGMPGDAPMSLQDFENNVVRPYKQITNWNVDLSLPKETMKNLPRALESHLESAVSSQGGQSGLGRYVASKRDYGKFADIADIAQTGVDRNTAKKAASLYDVMAMVGAGASSHSPVEGVLKAGGALAASKLASRFGNQLSATGANALARALSSSPAQGAPTTGLLAQLLSNSLGPRQAPSPAFASEEDLRRQSLIEALSQSGGSL